MHISCNKCKESEDWSLLYVFCLFFLLYYENEIRNFVRKQLVFSNGLLNPQIDTENKIVKTCREIYCENKDI